MDIKACSGSTAVEMGRSVEDEGGSAAMRTTETLLRILPMALCIASLAIMLKNSQTNEYGTLSYSDFGSFKYLVHASGICAGYSLLSTVAAAVPRPSTMSWAWTFFLLDQLFTYIILAAGAISAEAVYLAYNGDEYLTWSDACGTYDSFCRKATASVAITFSATLCYVGLSLISSYRLFTKYEAPVAYT
ncbi:CASP-like protein [Dorcoceras hygrometricum]|uniref:CASP-like protein n=1 Tax=Dorcoceras hygrometricum TaxID=472368 RepID=A0A2Z7B1R0_9LAMI|nr:CASP-like protein [Dorcoceras hygrometricum]